MAKKTSSGAAAAPTKAAKSFAVEQQTASSNAFSLTSKELEHWFASVEREHNPSSKADSYLATQYLARFGLKSPQDVLRFINSAAGHSIRAMIIEEIAKTESLMEYNAQQQAQAMEEQERLLALMMGLIFSREQHVKNLHDLMQQQIDKRLSDNQKAIQNKQKNAVEISLETVLESIAYYESAIRALDSKIGETANELRRVDSGFAALEQEGQQIRERHSVATAHLTELEDHLHHPNLVQPGLAPADREQTLHHLMEQVQAKLAEREHEVIPLPTRSREEVRPSVEAELTGLRLQERGLQHALQVHRKERVLLNADLQEVDSFERAHFVVDPNQRSRFKKHGDSFAILAEDQHHDKLTDSDWLQAKLNFEQSKAHVLVTRVLLAETIRQELDYHEQQRQQHMNKRDLLIQRLTEMNHNKTALFETVVQLNVMKDSLQQQLAASTTPLSTRPMPARTPQTPKAQEVRALQTPKPANRGSYANIMQNLACLVPATAPAPGLSQIKKVQEDLQKVVAPEQYGALSKLFGEVKPGQIMDPDNRLAWLHRARKLVPDLPAPELERYLDKDRSYKK